MELNSTTYQMMASDKDVSDPINIIQITDTHLFREKEGKLLGLETEKSLKAIVEHISEQEPMDLILATGDLAQDASSEAYRNFTEILSPLKTPVFWLPGNHDNTKKMSLSLINKTTFSQKRILMGNWQIIMLDSSVEGKVYGELSPSEIEFLSAALADKPELYTLVALHHQPVQLGSHWIDNIGLKNSAEFFAVLARHSRVRGIVWGHVHQEFTQKIGTVQLFSTPSTCVQFEPGSEDFEAGRQDPGYRRFQLFSEGEIESQVIRTKPFDFVFDYNVKGY